MCIGVVFVHMPHWKSASGLLVVGLLVLLALSVGTSEPADARARFFPIPNATADEAVLMPSEDDDVVVTGGIKCAEGQLVEINVTVTQETTGAVANGSTLTRCLGTDTQPRQWIVHAPTLSQTPFETDTAHIVVNTRTIAQGEETHEWSWETDVQLVRHYTASQLFDLIGDLINDLLDFLR